jgi:ribosomal protein S21
VKVVVGDGEPLSKALRRLKKLLDQQKPRYPRRREIYYLKPSEVCHRKRNNAKLVARQKQNWTRLNLGVEPTRRKPA